MVKKYVSEFDQWLFRFKQQQPNIEQQQREGRALLWDRPSKEIDRPTQAITNKQTGYVYYK